MKVYLYVCVGLGSLLVGCDKKAETTPNVDLTRETYDSTQLEQQIDDIETQLAALVASMEASDLAPLIERLDALKVDVQAAEEQHASDIEDLQETADQQGSDIASIADQLDSLDDSVATHATESADAHSALQARMDALEADIELLAEESSTGTVYTDEMAVAAVQNLDPWSDPEAANLTDLWSQTERGTHHLTESRWTMDNRTDPAGVTPRHELVQMFHETPECIDGATFAECNSAGALKIFVNGPRITDHDWSEAGLEAAARRHYHTHASGLYMVSFGQGSSVSDMPYGLIPPSGIHLEPRGAHQAIRIDSTNNSGENIRIDTTLGSTGIAIYESPVASPLCEDMPGECDRSHPLYIRGGRLHLEDIEVERSVGDARGAGPATLHTQSLGIEHMYSWHIDAVLVLDVPVHCTWNTRVTSDSIVKLTPYTTSPDLAVSHTYTIVDVWGPGEAPDACTVAQNIKTDAAGVYGYVFSESMMDEGGFSVAMLGPDPSVGLDPGMWGEADRPSFLFELIEPL
jgi:hypothetical protein